MYKVFGYDWFCVEYTFETSHFVDAVRYYLSKKENGDVAFISGVSNKVQQKLK